MRPKIGTSEEHPWTRATASGLRLDFLGMAGIGFTLPFFPLYLSQEGMSDRAIGFVSTLAALAGLVRTRRQMVRRSSAEAVPGRAVAVPAAATFLLHGAHDAVWLAFLVICSPRTACCRATVESCRGRGGAAASRARGAGRSARCVSGAGRHRLAALASGLIAQSHGVGAVLLPLTVVQPSRLPAALLIASARKPAGTSVAALPFRKGRGGAGAARPDAVGVRGGDGAVPRSATRRAGLLGLFPEARL